ncbi:MAG: 3',5'-bisphosphate nucleotidase, partial [Olpidium bornovanus]
MSAPAAAKGERGRRRRSHGQTEPPWAGAWRAQLPKADTNDWCRLIRGPPPVLARERSVAINAVARASRVCQAVAARLTSTDVVTKSDESPAVVNTILQAEFPEDRIVGEEDARDLRGDNQRAEDLRSRVHELANSALDGRRTAEQVSHVFRRFAGAAKGRQWTLDPIDGTKGFLRGGQYAVCLALIIDGQVELGVMGCPNLPVDPSNPDGERGCMFVTVRGQGAYQEIAICMSPVSKVSEAVFCESVEAGHSSHDDAAEIACALGITRAPVRMDSQCKYGTIARGAADIYLRLPVRKDYEENIWVRVCVFYPSSPLHSSAVGPNRAYCHVFSPAVSHLQDHAAGALLVHEAGGIVS